MTKTRYLHNTITSDLKDKMVFIGGPRQVGKTTLAKYIGDNDYKHPVYLNWHNLADIKIILGQKYPADADLIIFDEIHKYRQWKNFVKGEYDKNKSRFHIIVTGSARLDLYRRGGDSLLGRYHYYRLHPFSLRELTTTEPKIGLKELSFLPADENTRKIFSDLFGFGGFPEPLFKKNARFLRRFHLSRVERIVKEDIRDVENVRDLSALEILADILPEKVGSLLSINALKENLQVNFRTAALWMDILERLYYHFRIYPFAANSIKSLRKEPKMYLWDWSQIEGEAERLENMVASHLLKFTHYLRDHLGWKAELNFIRDREQREVDFLASINKKPWFAVEVKLKDENISKSLKYFKDRIKIPFSYQVIKENDVDFFKDGIRVMSVDKFLSGLV
ncbi:ATP-binding protein [Patescibacteria group bacterium]|nr:ATP-binding protein [Patescibacteria group bacterium]